MQLSIIIPALNEAALIAATLAPLQAMRRRGAEVILVDGGSADATKTLAAPLVDRVIESDKGRAHQMNAGAGAASKEVLLFLHADSLLPDAADRVIVEQLTAAGALWGRFDVQITGRASMFPVIAWCMNLRSRVTGIATGDQGLFVTCAAFEQCGGFPDQPLMEDIELCKRLKKIGAPVCLLEKITTSGRRWEQHGLWRTILLMWWLRLRYLLGASPGAIHRSYHGK